MAGMVTASACEEAGQAVSCRTIQELLQSCSSPSPFMDSLPNWNMAPRPSGAAAGDRVARHRAPGAVDGEREECAAVPPSDISLSLLERLQLPCAAFNPPVFPFGSPVIAKEEGAVGSLHGAAAVAGDDRESKASVTGPRPSSQGSPAAINVKVSETASGEWSNGRDSLSEHHGDDSASSGSGVSDGAAAAKFPLPLLDPFAALGRVATTTTCSVASTNDDAIRHEEVGRLPRMVVEHPPTAFPFFPTTSGHSVSAPLETDGESPVMEQEAELQTKLGGHGAAAGQLRSRILNGCQTTGSQVGGVWPLGSNAPCGTGSTEQLLQRVLHAMNGESSMSSGVWGAEGGDPRWEPNNLLSDVGRLGARSGGGMTLHNGGTESNEAFEQLLGLCAPQVAHPVAPWPLLHAPGVAATPSTGAAGGCVMGGSSIFGHGVAAAPSEPLAVSREGLSSNQIALLLQADLLRAQGLFNSCANVNGFGPGEVEEQMAKMRQLQSVPGVGNFAFHGQGQLYPGVTQPQEFSLFSHPGLTGAADLTGMGLDACGGGATAAVCGLAKPAMPGKKVKKDVGFAEPGQKKRVRKPKSKDVSRTESPIPGSPKAGNRKKREGVSGVRSAVDDTGDASSSSATSLANDLHAMAVLASMTEEDASELEAEAIRRQSNRSRNCPAEVINAVDFNGALIKFAKVIGLHYHPKQNRWLAWRSQKGSKKVFKSFSTKKFGIAGARLMALRWRLGRGIAQEDGQDALSDSNEIDDTIQSPSGDERDHQRLEAALGCDEVSDATGTGGAGSSESPTPLSGQEMVGGDEALSSSSSAERGAGEVVVSDEMSDGTATGGPGRSESSTPASDLETMSSTRHHRDNDNGEAGDEKWRDFEKKEALSPVAQGAGDGRADKLSAAPLSSLLSERLGLLLGSITPAADDQHHLTESDRNRLAALSSQHQSQEMSGEEVHQAFPSTSLADIVKGSAFSCNVDEDAQ